MLTTELNQPQQGRWVESVTDDPSIDAYKSRKRELRDRVAHARPDTLAIFAADKISKVRELALLPASHLREPETVAKLAHYRASLTMLQQVARDLTLVDVLATELNHLLTPAVTRNRGDGATQGITRANRRKPQTRTISAAGQANRAVAPDAVDQRRRSSSGAYRNARG